MEFVRHCVRLILMSLCLLRSPLVKGFPTEDNSYLDSFTYGEISDFISTENKVHHMEADLFTPGNILFSDGSSLKTTDGASTNTVAGHAMYPGYTEGQGGAARLNRIQSFYQLNKTHVIVVDTHNHCLRWVNRLNKMTSRFSGRCRTAGYTNGEASIARFHFPCKITLDKTNNNSLIVSHNHASNNGFLRAVAIDTGTVSTAVSSGFNAPKDMVWDTKDNSLYVTNSHYIAKVNWTTKRAVRLAGSTSSGNRNGNFSQSLFRYPTELLHLRDHIYILNERHSKRLKSLNIKNQTVSPVCVGGSCSLENDVYSIASINHTLFVGELKKIRKLTGLNCALVENNIYINPGKTTASVTLDSHGNIGEFPAGEYKFHLDARNCSSYVANVKNSPVVRRMVLKAEYNVSCSNMLLGTLVGRALLEPILKHKMTDYHDICHTDCKMSISVKPSYTCVDSALTVIWPTDTVYPMNIKEVPSSMRKVLQERLRTAGKEKAELMVLNQISQLILPQTMPNGQSVQVAFNMTCAEDGKQYQPSTDQCI